MNKLLKKSANQTVLFGLLCLCTATVSAGEHILIPKFGMVKIKNNTNHLVDNNSFDFDDDNEAALGFSYLYQLDNGFSFGADVFGYEKNIITTANNNGDATIAHAYAVAQKFFYTSAPIKPYIGIGIGRAAIQFDANVNGRIADDYSDQASGFSYEIYAGFEIEISKRVGMMFEYKHFNIDVNDDIGIRDINFESDGDAIFLGVSIHI